MSNRNDPLGYTSIQAIVDRNSIESTDMSKTYAEIIGEKLSKAGWSWGIGEYLRPDGIRMWSADAHQGNLCPRYIVQADSELGAMVQLKKDIAGLARSTTG